MHDYKHTNLTNDIQRLDLTPMAMMKVLVTGSKPTPRKGSRVWTAESGDVIVFGGDDADDYFNDLHIVKDATRSDTNTTNICNVRTTQPSCCISVWRIR